MSAIAFPSMLPAVAALLGLAGCSMPSAQRPLLALTSAHCDSTPAFAAAVPVRTTDSRGTTVTLDAAGRCLLQPGAAPTTYAVFALPSVTAPYTVEILSSIVPDTIVLPRATLYDASGTRIRTILPEEFENNLNGLRAGVRPIPSEHWLVVAADPSKLGEDLTLKLGSLNGRVRLASVVYVPIIIIAPHGGQIIRSRHAAFGLNGSITVIAALGRKAL